MLGCLKTDLNDIFLDYLKTEFNWKPSPSGTHFNISLAFSCRIQVEEEIHALAKFGSLVFM